MEVLNAQIKGYKYRVVICGATFYGSCRYVVQTLLWSGWKTLKDFPSIAHAKEWLAKL